MWAPSEAESVASMTSLLTVYLGDPYGSHKSMDDQALKSKTIQTTVRKYPECRLSDSLIVVKKPSKLAERERKKWIQNLRE